MAVNMVLSQMLSCMMISCALALIVMFSLVFEAHFGFSGFCFTNFSHFCATELTARQPNQTWLWFYTVVSVSNQLQVKSHITTYLNSAEVLAFPAYMHCITCPVLLLEVICASVRNSSAEKLILIMLTF